MCSTDAKAKSTCAVQCIAKKIPEANCITKTNPSKDPNPHQQEILDGAGRSTTIPFTMLNSGCFFKSLI